MRIGIAADHRCQNIKNSLTDYLKKEGYEVISYGNDLLDPTDDYPIFALALGEGIKSKEIDMGIVACGTGIGASIACNKVKGVRCALVDSIKNAEITRIDNDANVIALSETYSLEFCQQLVDTFLKTSFTKEERHLRRINQIKNYEENHEC